MLGGVGGCGPAKDHLEVQGRTPTGQGAAEALKLRVVLRWKTETESNTFGYFVHRADAPGGEMRCINAENPIHAAGNSTAPARYVYFDLDVREGGVYYYKLESRDLDGSSEWIVGGDKPVEGHAKAMTEVEADELQTKGTSYREEVN